jgi:hypothetical protein
MMENGELNDLVGVLLDSWEAAVEWLCRAWNFKSKRRSSVDPGLKAQTKH